ncbi:MAG: RHS repeat-associated core domain-containing protein, partial [Kiritimatiellae bacterium]|nr:RHS repeat-associated core domain-containing protein [Kiritimatiellia bacterium]
PGPHALTGTDSGYTITYDDSGNMLESRGNSYTWDSAGRLESVVNANGTLRFVYDHSGARILKYLENDPSSETVYLTSSYEIRDDKAVKFIFAGPVRAARIEGPVPVPDQVIQREVLTPGWNLVPLRVTPAQTSPSQVLDSIQGQYTAVYKTQGDDYLKYVPGEGSNSLTSMVAGSAYWIIAEEACTLEITGARYTPTTQSFQAGWQAISFGASEPRNLNSFFASNPQLLSVWKYNSTSATFQSFTAVAPPFLQTLAYAQPGEALLVKSSGATSLDLSSPSRRVFFYHADHLGSGNVVTDEAGLIVEELYNYPFGLLRHRHTPQGELYQSEYTFSGKELDESSQLFFFGARYYDPILCVFISVDPVALHQPGATISNSLRMNAYIYAGNNPLVLVDPDGRFWSEIISVVSAVVSVYFPPAAYIGGALSGAVGAIENGGGLQDAFFGALRGGLSGYISGGISQSTTSMVSSLGIEALSSTGANMFQAGLTSYISTGVQSTLQGNGWQHASFKSVMTTMLTAGVVSELKSAQASSTKEEKYKAHDALDGDVRSRKPAQLAMLADRTGNRMNDYISLDDMTVYGAFKTGHVGNTWSNGLTVGGTQSYGSFLSDHQVLKETVSDIFPKSAYEIQQRRNILGTTLKGANDDMLGIHKIHDVDDSMLGIPARSGSPGAVGGSLPKGFSW